MRHRRFSSQEQAGRLGRGLLREFDAVIVYQGTERVALLAQLA